MNKGYSHLPSVIFSVVSYFSMKCAAWLLLFASLWTGKMQGDGRVSLGR